MKRTLILAITHTVAIAFGFGLGIYFLPILTAEDAPEAAVLEEAAAAASYSAQFTRDLRGSDALHWAEGSVSVSAEQISHQGEMAPGPNYKLYLTKAFVEHEDEFEPIKSDAALIGDIKSYDGFLLNVPAGVDVEEYNTVVVWCERFGEFITAAQYR